MQTHSLQKKKKKPTCTLFSCYIVSNSLQPHGLQHTRLSCTSPSPRACSNSYPLSWWCNLAISSSLAPFSSCPQSFSASSSYLLVLNEFLETRLSLYPKFQIKFFYQKPYDNKDSSPPLVPALHVSNMGFSIAALLEHGLCWEACVIRSRVRGFRQTGG